MIPDFLKCYTYGFQLLPSSGCKEFVTNKITSTIHHTPMPPNVNSLPTAVPVCPRQNRSIPRKPNRILYRRVVAKYWPLYFIHGIPSRKNVLGPKHSISGSTVQDTLVFSTSS